MNSIYFRWIVPTIIIMFLASPASAEVGKTVSEFENSEYFQSSGFTCTTRPTDSEEGAGRFTYRKGKHCRIAIWTEDDGETIRSQTLLCAKHPAHDKAFGDGTILLLEPFLLEASGNKIPKEKIAALIEKIKQKEALAHPFDLEPYYVDNLRMKGVLVGYAHWFFSVGRKLTEEEKKEAEEAAKYIELG